MDRPDAQEVVWDERNLFHPSGADLYIGRAPGGRPLAVVTIGYRELYPRTAWWVSDKEWRKLNG